MRHLALLILCGGCEIVFPLDPPGDAAGDATGDAAGSDQGWTIRQIAPGAHNVTLTPTAAGSLLVVAVELDDPSLIVNMISDNRSNLYTPISQARSVDTNTMSAIELWYVPNAQPGVTLITVDSNTTINATVVWEVSGLPNAVVDAADKADNQAASVTPSAPPIVTSVAGDFMVAVTIVSETVTGMETGNEFINDQIADGNGWAHVMSKSAPAGSHRAVWTQDLSGGYCSSAAAFKSSL